MFTYGIKINVTDIMQAKTFYGDKLGFEVEDSGQSGMVILRSEEREKLILCEVEQLAEQNPNQTRLSFTLQVNELDRSIERMKSLGVEFAKSEIRKEGVGNAISILDPFGRSISLMHQTIVPVDPFKEPKLYNFGFRVPDMDIARDFYCKKLGLVELSEKYLPRDMPLGHSDNSFAFMLHYRDKTTPIKSNHIRTTPYNILVLETDDLERTTSELKGNGIIFTNEQPLAGPIGKQVAFIDPFGNHIELIEVPE